ncbi:hypothetical protein DH2020_047991 [Rehmannia glutinosa]|uniref:Polymerase nucleotidyl transferase domain-containing protein n=1 Tax=Rehmannia glutinosa TaxID=99300 RepID=A0ABR0U6Q9_REHGL
MGDLPGGGAAAELKNVASHATSSADQNPFEIGTEHWATAERAAHGIIRKIQPNSVSEERRREVVDYIQRLIRNCLGAEVFPYGSVPLKTYLPDGDIDLTTFGGANVEDTLANDMKSILEEEEKNASSEFVVKDVQLVRAEVKLVKCIVQDIVVDVSFNQIGGLCTLCFLEQVDRHIGKDHLFKRSIILIKAWCYYESRILGAHHGLISTYALETLVLYIFHLFHSTLDGPLAVLFKFLDYFSKFDWETYSVSLNGPVRLSSLPAVVVEMPEDSDKDLLLSSDFLSSCVGMFSVPSRGGDKNSRGFQLKHLNIFDPLKDINNLGRSVSKGNFYRIRSAFSYGARKLARILLQPADSITNELHRFFSNTMARHGSGQRPDVQGFDPSLICTRPISAVPIPETRPCKINNLYRHFDRSSVLEHPSVLLDQDLNNLKISTDSSIRQTPIAKEAVTAVGTPYHAPHMYFSNSKSRDGATWDKNPDSDKDEVDFSGDRNHMDSDQGSASRSETPESLNPSDLTGDYESYLQCLRHGRWCYEYGLGMHSLPLPPMPTTPYQNNSPWDGGILPVSHYKQNGFSYRHHNGFHPSSQVYAVQPVLLPGVTFGWEEVPKPRGTGTYFPNPNQSPQGYRSSAGIKGRNQAPSRSPRNNGRNMIFTDPNMLDRSTHELSQPQVRFDKNPMVNSSDSDLSFSPRRDGYPNVNGLFIPPEGVIEFEPVGHEKSRQQKPVSSSPRTFSGLQRSQSSLSREQDRVLLGSSYRLKDEDDFPPLPV